MKNKRRKDKKKAGIIHLAWYLIIIGTVLSAAYVIIQITLKHNAQSRAFDELDAKVQLQVMMLDEIVNREYTHLRVLNSILEFSNEKVEKEQFDRVWELMKEEEQITMLGISDLSGNVVNWNGERLEEISRKKDFKEILSEAQTNRDGRCVLLENTESFEKSELLYIVPLYIKGEVKGVLFKSKMISSVEDTLVDDINFDGNASMFLVDTSGKILLVGDKQDRCLLSNHLFQGESNFIFTDEQKKELKNNLRNGKSGKMIFKERDQTKYAVYMPSGVGDWTIFSMVDEKAAALKYEKNDSVVEGGMLIILILFVFSLIVLVVLTVLHIEKRKELQIEHFYQYHIYKQLMNELNFPGFRYHLKYDSMIGNKKFQEAYGHRQIFGFMKNSEKWRRLHPEYNFSGLFRELENVVKYQKVIVFESMWQSSEKNCWIKNILVPVKDENGGEVIVFGIVIDTTKEHGAFESMMDMMNHAQIGLYRFCLNEAFGIEYISEGFQKMIGYTEEEIEKILGEDRNYTHLLMEQDREKYKAFVRGIKVGEMAGDCEYSMRCKDGSILKISDTLEIKEGSDKKRYGYGVVTDISKYQEAQKNAEKKVESLQIQLNESRIKISTGQMQPHFLYNALASIREVVLENPEYASDLIFDFTTYLRACIKSMSSDKMMPFSQEIENIKAYVNIEKMRFGDKLEVKYEINKSDFMIVPLSIQPLVENAIRHGIYERGSRGGVVIIRSGQEEKDIVICVEDNGVGFNVKQILSEIQSKNRDSIGLSSLMFRFEKLMNAKVKLESVEGEGTRITVRIPMEGGNEQ